MEIIQDNWATGTCREYEVTRETWNDWDMDTEESLDSASYIDWSPIGDRKDVSLPHNFKPTLP